MWWGTDPWIRHPGCTCSSTVTLETPESVYIRTSATLSVKWHSQPLTPTASLPHLQSSTPTASHLYLQPLDPQPGRQHFENIWEANCTSIEHAQTFSCHDSLSNAI
jgi:hypothetical protein